jgi:hypothetical protein
MAKDLREQNWEAHDRGLRRVDGWIIRADVEFMTSVSPWSTHLEIPSSSKLPIMRWSTQRMDTLEF